MIDKEFDITHCLSCTRTDVECGVCQDAFYGSAVFRRTSFFGPLTNTGEKFIMRYAQRRFLEFFAATV